MKATIERATLLKALSHVQSVVERRNTIPILSNVLLEASEDGGLRLMATDLDIQINETVAAQVSQPGSTTVSAHTLFDIARKLPEGSQVELHAAEGKMRVDAGRARFNLSTLPRDDFPVMDADWRHLLLVCSALGEDDVELVRREQVPMRPDLFDLFELDELKKYYTGDELGGHRAGEH